MVGVGLIALAVALAYAAHRLAQAWERVALPVPKADTLSAPVVVPDDLKAWAAEFGEAWAVEDVIKACEDRYRTLQDWNLVRRAVGVGQRT